MKKMNDLMDKAKIWYDLSAKQGYIPAKVGLAKMLLEDPTHDNVAKAIAIYEEADKADNVDATYNLGFVQSPRLCDVDLLRGPVQHTEGPREGLPVHRARGGTGRRVGVLLPGLCPPPRTVRARQPERGAADDGEGGGGRREAVRCGRGAVHGISEQGRAGRALEGHAVSAPDVSERRRGREKRAEEQ